MSKITKKSFIEKELEKYNSEQVELAISCKVIVILKKWTWFGNIITYQFWLTNKWKKLKIDKIRTKIKSFLYNQDNDDRRFYWDTSSENIESIEINLEFK